MADHDDNDAVREDLVALAFAPMPALYTGEAKSLIRARLETSDDVVPGSVEVHDDGGVVLYECRLKGRIHEIAIDIKVEL